MFVFQCILNVYFHQSIIPSITRSEVARFCNVFDPCQRIRAFFVLVNAFDIGSALCPASGDKSMRQPLPYGFEVKKSIRRLPFQAN